MKAGSLFELPVFLFHRKLCILKKYNPYENMTRKGKNFILKIHST